MQERKREEWVDVAKAICIVCMVMGHASAPFGTYIYMFHIPAFFILSGYTYNGEKYSWLDYCLKKIKVLLIPMFVINTLFIVFYALAENFGFYQYIQTSTYLGIRGSLSLLFSRNLGTTELGGATWFIFVLCITEIIFKSIQRCVNDSKWEWVGGIAIGLVGYILAQKQYYMPFMLDLCFMACLYFTIGVLLKRCNVLEEIFNKLFMVPISIAIMVLFGRTYFAGKWPMNWPTRQFDDIFVQIFTVMSGFYLCYVISKLIVNNKNKKICQWISYIGRHSYVILIFHFAVFKLITVFFVSINMLPQETLLEFPLPYQLTLHWCGVTIATIIMCLIWGKVCEKNRVLNYVFNASIDSEKENLSVGIRKSLLFIKNNNICRYTMYLFCILVIYIFSLKFIFPQHFEPLIPHHSDILDYPYDMAMSGSNLLSVFAQPRPVGMILTWASGLLGGYKGVMVVGAVCTFASMLLMVYFVEKELHKRVWFGAVLIYALLLISSPSFYLNYTFDLYNVFALLFGLLTVGIWYYTYNKKCRWGYLLVFILAICNYLSKETYIITFCAFFFFKMILEKSEMRKRASIFLGLNIIGAIIALLQARMVKSVFSSMLVTDVSSPYYSSFAPKSLIKTAMFYMNGFSNPWLLLMLSVAILLCVYIHKKNALGLLVTVLCGMAAYVPYLVLPNRTIPHSFFIAYIMMFSIVLSIAPEEMSCIRLMDKRRKNIVVFGCLSVLMIVNVKYYSKGTGINSYGYALAYLGAEPAMKVTLDSAERINNELGRGDRVLVKGIEPYVETAFRAYSADRMFRSDVEFYVLTDYSVYTGMIAPNVIYIDKDEENQYTYTAEINYTMDGYTLIHY